MQRKYLCLLLFLYIILTSCAPGKLLSSTIAPLPTITPTFTPTITSTYSVTPSPTFTHTPTITPIPTVDYNQAFFDPQSEADFPRVIESPSPIDDPVGFAVWQEGYLAAVDEKLKNYTGPYIVLDNIGYQFDGGNIVFWYNEWRAVGSYKFDWRKQEILNKTFVVRDQNGNLVPFSVTYTTPDSPVFVQRMMYRTPSVETMMYMRYEWNSAKMLHFTDPFIDSYLSDNGKYFESWQRFFGGVGTEEDKYNVSRMRFVLATFGH
jgi:hypothetical protein